MYISINHRTEKFLEENFKVFTIEEFIEHVQAIAQSVGVEVLPEIYFYKENDGTVGVCFSDRKVGNTEIIALAFYDKLLDGKSYTIHQVNETIRHELAHLIADLRYNDNCGHDERFMNVVREIGGEPSESLSLFKYSATFHTEKLKDTKRNYKFYLLCSSCGKVHKRTNEYRNVFQLFALSGTDSPLTHLIKFGELGCKSPCCNTCYSFEANVESLLMGLEKDNQLIEFQQHLKGLLSQRKSIKKTGDT